MQLVRPLGRGGVLAVASETTAPYSRVVVDEYVVQPSGGYKLQSIATDLLTYLHK